MRRGKRIPPKMRWRRATALGLPLSLLTGIMLSEAAKAQIAQRQVRTGNPLLAKYVTDLTSAAAPANGSAGGPASVSNLVSAPANSPEALQLDNLSLAEALEGVERRMISEAMRRHKGNISRVAHELGLTRRGLYLKLDRYNIREREGTHD